MDFLKRLITPKDDKQPNEPSLVLGSGRRLHSDLTQTECINTIERILLSVRPSEMSYRPLYAFPGWRWMGAPDQNPQTSITFNDFGDQNRAFYLIAFWPTNRGTECGLFPLGSGNERLTSLPLIGRWKQQDSSLTSVGVIPGGQIALTPPRISDQFFTELLNAASFPFSPRNLQSIGIKVGEMFRSKAGQFIADNDPRAAQNFVSTHPYNGGSIQSFCQGILDDFAAQYPRFLPYIQDLPGVVRGILLSGVNEQGSIWETYER